MALASLSESIYPLLLLELKSETFDVAPDKWNQQKKCDISVQEQMWNRSRTHGSSHKQR